MALPDSLRRMIEAYWSDFNCDRCQGSGQVGCPECGNETDCPECGGYGLQADEVQTAKLEAIGRKFDELIAESIADGEENGYKRGAREMAEKIIAAQEPSMVCDWLRREFLPDGKGVNGSD